MYQIVICDDNGEFIKDIKNIILKSGVKQEEVSFTEYTSGEEMLAEIEKFQTIHLLVLDMQMKQLDGNETAALFRRKFPFTLLVFCSGVCLPTVESFEVTPFRYLLKEYTEEKMIHEMKAIVEEMRLRQVFPTITATWKHNTVELQTEEILYISIARNGCNIFINPKCMKYEFETHVTTRMKLPQVYKLLQECGFEYAHNSYIVNLNYVKRKTSTELELTDGTVLSIARSKEKQLRSSLAKWKARKY